MMKVHPCEVRVLNQKRVMSRTERVNWCSCVLPVAVRTCIGEGEGSGSLVGSEAVVFINERERRRKDVETASN